ncbi:MAG: methyl-accepting chemotaxis protein [Oscillospiraceae bacterium]|jgi:methyl-accepting chemotaxis protein|nr:methyl-accepting chemotaxis protein [Oscillospiraceae bacterium]
MMWWRNLKISKKLLLGFGLVVIVFVATVFVMRSYISVVEKGSNQLTENVSKVLGLASDIYTESSELFLAMRAVQYKESQESIKEYNDQLAKVISIENDFIEFNKKYPELEGPAYAVQTSIPARKKYQDIAEKAFALMVKKQDMLKVLAVKGNDLSVGIDSILNQIHKQLKSDIEQLYTGGNRERDREDALNLGSIARLGASLSEKIMAVRRDAWHAIAYANAGISTDGLLSLNNKIDELLDNAKRIEQHILNIPEAVKDFEKLNSDLAEYNNFLKTFSNICIDLAQAHLDRIPVMNDYSDTINHIINGMVERVKNVSSENVDNLSTATFAMTASAICCVLFALIIALAISSSISKPLNKIVSLARRAGEGDLTVKKADFSYDGRDEMGSMVSALAEMVESQSSTMTNIVKIAEDLAGGASNLSAISEETSASMEEIKASIAQAKELSETNGAALEESNAGVEEMSAGADTVARSATDSAAFIAQTTDASNNAIDTVRDVIKGMRNVDKNARESEGKIQQLVLSVENVSSFVSVITGIADQTNLLALNAAIEAARAGEVGRGFAVVAEEVRKLAEESARAAQNVNGIIKELQTGAQESIKATTEAGHLLATTLDHAEQALKELNGAMDQINKANDSIQNIAAIAEEQAASSKEVAQAIDNATKSSVKIVGTISSIHNASDETAKATEGVAKHAESMTEYSSTLTNLLSRFKLDVRSANTKMLKGR